MNSNPKISIIAAVASNYAIGKNNDLLWSLPADLAHFKKHTTGCPIIMGRKTFESIGRPLPNRRNIIVSRQEDYQVAGCEVYPSLEEALRVASLDLTTHDELFIIGGGQLYREAMPLAQMLYITWVHTEPDADTFFPEIDSSVWTKTATEFRSADDKNELDMEFCVYRRTESAG